MRRPGSRISKESTFETELQQALMQCSKQRTYAMSVGVSTICGRRIVKIEPRPGLLSTVMSPPIMWAAGRRAAEATAESKQPQGLAGNHLHNVFEGISRPALPMPAISRHPPVARWTVEESDHEILILLSRPIAVTVFAWVAPPNRGNLSRPHFHGTHPGGGAAHSIKS